MHDVRVTIGDRWVQKLAALHAQADWRPANHAIDLAILRDVVDIEVDDHNLTSVISAESIFPFLDAALAALVRLRSPDRRKVFVECQDEPWEFALTSGAGSRVAISLYSLDRAREVIAHDLIVSHASLEQAFVDATEEALAHVNAIDAELSAGDDLLSSIRKSRAALTKRPLEVDPSKRPPRTPPYGFALRSGSVHTARGWGVTWRWDGAYPGLKDFSEHTPLDLHALLVRGEILMEDTHDNARLEVHGYPLLMMGELLRRAAEIVEGRAEAPREAPLRVEALEARAGRWRLRIEESSEHHMTVAIAARTFIDTLVLCARRLLDDVASVHPPIRKNRRLAQWYTDIDALTEWLERASAPSSSANASASNVSHRARPSEASAQAHARQQGAFPHSMERVLRMHPRVAWSWSGEGANVRRAKVGAGHIYIPTAQELIAVDAERGVEAWRYDEGAVRLGALRVLDDRIVLHQPRHDEMVALDALTGRVLARFDLGRPHRVVDWGQTDAGYLLLLDERGAITALDVDAGGVVWHRAGGARGQALHASGEDLLATLQQGTLTRVDPATGEALWQVEAGQYGRGVVVHQGRIVVIGAGSHRAQTHVRGFDATDGQRTEEVSLDGYFLGPCVRAGAYLVMAIERGRRPVLEVLHGSELHPAWMRPLGAQARTLAPTIQIVEAGGEPCVLVHTSAEELVMIDLAEGHERWSVEGAPLMRAPTACAMVRDGVLSLGESLELRLASDGTLLHRFEGFLDEPSLMQVHGELDVLLGEQPIDGQVASMFCLRFGHFLAVV